MTKFSGSYNFYPFFCIEIYVVFILDGLAIIVDGWQICTSTDVGELNILDHVCFSELENMSMAIHVLTVDWVLNIINFNVNQTYKWLFVTVLEMVSS